MRSKIYRYESFANVIKVTRSNIKAVAKWCNKPHLKDSNTILIKPHTEAEVGDYVTVDGGNVDVFNKATFEILFKEYR